MTDAHDGTTLDPCGGHNCEKRLGNFESAEVMAEVALSPFVLPSRYRLPT